MNPDTFCKFCNRVFTEDTLMEKFLVCIARYKSIAGERVCFDLFFLGIR